MAIVSRGASLAFLLLLPTAALAQAPSGWAQGLHSRVRLLSGGPEGHGRLAGIEIVLDRGFKTYWRQPGESGLPPRFDWSASANAASIAVLWPAPRRLEDAGGVAYVYADRVVLPVRVTPADPRKPVDLRLAFDYGVCKEICIPARAEIAATLSVSTAEAPAADRALVEDLGLARVPRPVPLGAPGPLSVEAVAETSEGGKPGYIVSVRGPADATLFAEGPDDWYLSTSAPKGDGRFKVVIDEKPKDARGPVTLRLTLAAGPEAIESDLHLDEGLRPR